MYTVPAARMLNIRIPVPVVSNRKKTSKLEMTVGMGFPMEIGILLPRSSLVSKSSVFGLCVRDLI